MSLKRNTNHNWTELGDGSLECSRCGRPFTPTHPGHEPPQKYCKGLRQSRINPVSQRKARSRLDDDGNKVVYGPYFKWAAQRKCFVCYSYPCVPHHLKTVKTGGVDRQNIIDVCLDCHSTIESKGLSFWERSHNVDASDRANKLWEIYDDTIWAER